LSIRNRAAAIAAALIACFALVLPASAAFAGSNPSPGSPSPNIGVTSDCPTPTPTQYAPAGVPSSDLGVNPSPCPTPTVPVPQPCPLIGRDGTPLPLPTDPRALATALALCRGIQQEDFGFTDTNLIRNGLVTATGPIRFSPFAFGLRGRDFTLSPTLDRLSALFGSVLLHSEPIAVTVDRQACTLVVDQRDMPWFILPRTGTGIYRNDEGAGVYDLAGVFSFPTWRFRCSLPAGLTDAQASADVNANFAGLPAPDDWGISVNATGWVAPRGIRVPKPCDYGCTPAPDAYLGRF